MATVLNPFVNGKFTAVDDNGAPLAGGKLYTYSAGTTSPLATYPITPVTVGVSTTNANPVVLDASGQANVWLQPGLLYKFVLTDSADQLQWTVDNWPSPAETAATDSSVAATEPGGRLTLDQLNPTNANDMGGATTVYYVPYKSDKVPIYDGTGWTLHSLPNGGLSNSTSDNSTNPAAVANNTNYDVFIWHDSSAGTLRLSRGPAWSSSTVIGTGAGTSEREQVNGRYVNMYSITNGPAAQCGLYVGTIRSDGSAQINDTPLLRHVWNCNNRVVKYMQRVEATASWGYTGGVYRQANGSAANQLDFLIGLVEDSVTAFLQASGANASVTDSVAVGIGLDSTTTPIGLRGFAPCGNDGCTLTAAYDGLPGGGRHTLAWLELSGSATTSWKGQGAGPFLVQTGITGRLMA
jgi:hypothetical protein